MKNPGGGGRGREPPVRHTGREVKALYERVQEALQLHDLRPDEPDTAFASSLPARR